ncbi:unnamed protein product [Polarella glacialis]|uniref:C3H1-type domain-containing protein n=1 Tax=Polarella glacialis TaxID=89957 RepID=A0A813LPJ4_POLGL|nr:unnamed protein product [Polarella glacialis]CAE8734178.1 unnamed protein product [Polarella glacialis]
MEATPGGKTSSKQILYAQQYQCTRELGLDEASLSSHESPEASDDESPFFPPDPAEDLVTLLEKVPVSGENNELTSIGSLGHPTTCTPCVFHVRKMCSVGIRCGYCHFPHIFHMPKIRGKLRRLQRFRIAATQDATAETQDATAESQDATAESQDATAETQDAMLVAEPQE